MSQMRPKTLDRTLESVVDEFQIVNLRLCALTRKKSQPIRAKPCRRRGFPQISAMTAPRVFTQGLSPLPGNRRAFVSQTHWIQMDVAEEFHGITVRFHQMRLEAPLEEMAAAPVPAIETNGVSSLQSADSAAEITVGRFQQQVVMVRHQTVSVKAQSMPLDRFFQRTEEQPAIGIVAECPPPLVTSRCDVVNRTSKFDSDGARHCLLLADERPSVKCHELPPSACSSDIYCI